MGESETVIRVENLSKRYVINHADDRERYATLRDAVSGGVRRLSRRLRRRQQATNATSEEFWALKDVSFEVKRGEVVGIIGRNGAGKSTLLKILSRITEPTSGRIEIDGRVASLLEVGTGFHPELTGRENVYLNGSILGMSRAEIRAKFDEIVAFAEIEKFLDTPVKRYSSGMYMRLAFAVAAHLEPEILIVDEVLAVGDAAFQKKCLGKMNAVAKGGRSILFVSHNVTALATLCNSGLLFNQGQLTLQGEIGSCISNYLSQGPLSTQSTAGATVPTGGAINITVRDLKGGHLAPTTLQYPGRYILEFTGIMPAGPSLNLGFTVINAEEQPIISSSVRDSGLQIKSGIQRLSIELPVSRLPSGDYRIEAAVWDSEKVHFQSDGLLFFTVVNIQSALDAMGGKPRGGTILEYTWSIQEFASHPWTTDTILSNLGQPDA